MDSSAVENTGSAGKFQRLGSARSAGTLVAPTGPPTRSLRSARKRSNDAGSFATLEPSPPGGFLGGRSGVEWSRWSCYVAGRWQDNPRLRVWRIYEDGQFRDRQLLFFDSRITCVAKVLSCCTAAPADVAHSFVGY